MRRPWQTPLVGPARPLTRLLPSIRSVVACYFGAAVEAAVFLLLTPFMVRRLGLGEFGIWSLAVALADWLQLLDFGLREAVMKYTAAHQARSDAQAVRRVADTALFFYGAAAFAALGIGLGLVWLGLPFMTSDPAVLGPTRLTLVLLVISTTLSLPAGIAGTLLEGLSRFDLLSLFRVGHAALRLVLVVGFLQSHLGVVGVALAELIARVVLHTVRWAALYRIDPGLVPRPLLHAADRQRLLGFGAWNALRQVGEVGLAKLYEPILALFAGLPSVGAFYVGRRLGSMPAEIIVPMAGVLLPLSSEMEAAGRNRALRQTFEKSTKIASSIGVPLCLVLAFGAEPILGNWLGGRVPEAVPVLRIFAVHFLLVAISLPSEVLLLGMGRVRLLALLGAGQVALIVVLGVALARAGGVTGLALASLAGVVLFQALVPVPVAARLAGATFGKLVRRAIGPPILVGASVGMAMWILRGFSGGGLAALAAWAGGAVLSYLLLMWRFGIDQEEKAFMRSHLNRLLVPPEHVTDWDDLP